MTDAIISAFKDTLDQVSWMDTFSRDLAHDKAENTQHRVAYPEYLLNDTYLQQVYNV